MEEDVRGWGAFVGVFAALVVTNGLAGPLVLAGGLRGMATPGAIAAAVGLAGLLWAAVAGVTDRSARGAGRTGLRPTGRTLAGGAIGLLAGAALAGLAVATAVLSGGARLAWGAPTASPVLAAVALAVNAPLQDLGLLGLGRALGGRAGWAVAIAAFTALHLAESTAPVYVANVAAFGLLLVAAFHVRPAAPDAGLPMGLHAGVNATLAGMGALPGTSEVAAASLSTSSAAWGGGDGLESGPGWSAALALALAAVGVARARAGDPGEGHPLPR